MMSNARSSKRNIPTRLSFQRPPVTALTRKHLACAASREDAPERRAIDREVERLALKSLGGDDRTTSTWAQLTQSIRPEAFPIDRPPTPRAAPGTERKANEGTGRGKPRIRVRCC